MSEKRPPSSPDYIPTSTHLSRLLNAAEGNQVTVKWLTEQLGLRSFGLTLIMMALIAFVPGASIIVGILIAWPATQMILGHNAPVLPRVIARRKISVDKLARTIGILTPRLRWMERLIQPRWTIIFRSSKRPTGILMLLLGLTLISPFPFSHVIPAFVIMLLALAYLEEDGLVLIISLAASLASFTITVAALWGTVETADWLNRI